MEVFDKIGYRKNPRVSDRDLIDLLTGDSSASLYLSVHNKSINRENLVPIGANFGKCKAGGSVFLRGFEFENDLYEIDSQKKLIIHDKKKGMENILSELDKVENDYVVRHSFEEVLKEFCDIGYKIIEKS